MHHITLGLTILFAAAGSNLEIQNSHTTESLRGVSAVSRQIIWASGTHGTYLRTTDGGQKWISAQVPGAANLDFRGVMAFSPGEAFVMSAGPGDQSRIYHTADSGQHWQLQFTNSNPKGFFDSMAFWDRTHGIVLGDPLADESGKLKFEVLLTDDGQTWHSAPSSQLPDAVQGEGAFAASNSCIAVVEERRSSSTSSGKGKGKGASAPTTLDANIWFATGGTVARVFHSPDRGHTWQIFNTPIVHGRDSTGIFSIAFRDAIHGVIAGGDYKHPNDDGPNLAFTDDGGKTWTLAQAHPQEYFSSAAYERASQRVFVVGQGFILDVGSGSNPQRLTARGVPDAKWNAMRPFPEGGGILVGPNGSIAVTNSR